MNCTQCNRNLITLESGLLECPHCKCNFYVLLNKLRKLDITYSTYINRNGKNYD